MNAETWQELQRLLNSCFDLPLSERAAFLDEHCPDPELREEVLSLLAAAETTSEILERSPVREFVKTNIGKNLEQVGPYRLLECLGDGGMGSVFLARRTDDVHHHEVAVKLLQVGLGSQELIRRFEREREILAHLEHPHIARLLDGGTADDGRPYLVMERVVGMPIDEFCRQQELDIESRIRLFQKVCMAVQFAHQNLIVHRDIKPANIFVTPEGEPKLLDFGIAKLLSPESFPLTVVTTAPGHSPMTPSWASPEQMRGEHISTGSDIYSLGILLYHLLTGHRPHDLQGCTFAKAIWIVSEQEAEKPSSKADSSSAAGRALRRRLEGDLDHIVLKTLRKDPQKRYISAEQLAQDLDRHLGGLAVLARKGTFAYRTGKFLRRHRVAVISTVGAFTLLLAFLAVTLYQQAEVTKQRDRFERIANLLIGVFNNPNPRQAGNVDLTARQLLEAGAESLSGELADQPDIQADMHIVIGRSFHGLGRLDQASDQFYESLGLRQEFLTPNDTQIAESLAYIAQVESDLGHFDNAVEAAEEALRIRELAFEPPRAELADSLYRMAWILERQGDYEESETYYRRALEQARELQEPEMLSEILATFGILLRERGVYDEAQELLQEALTIRREHYGPEHAVTGGSLNSLGLLYDKQGLGELAEEHFREALALARRFYDGPHRATASFLSNLGNILTELGQYEEAEMRLKEAIVMSESLYEGPHPDLATQLGQLAYLFDRMSRWGDADPVARRALAMRRGLFGNEHKDVALSCDYLGKILGQLGQHDEAAALFEEAIDIYQRTVGEDHPQMAMTLNNLASLEFQRGDRDKAKELFKRALEARIRVHGEDHPEVGSTAYNLGFLHHRAGEIEEAEKFYQQAEAIARKSQGGNSPKLGYILTLRGRLAIDRGEPLVAEKAAREAIEILTPSLPWKHARRHYAELLLASSLRDQGRLDEAEGVLMARLDRSIEVYGPESPPVKELRELLERVEALR